MILELLVLSAAMAPSTNAPFTHTIQDILDEYEYTRPTKLNEFDCTDHSMLTWEILHDHNYNPTLFVGNSSGSWHMWVGVEDRHDEWVMIETLGDDTRLGTITTETEFFEPTITVSGPEYVDWVCDGDTNGLVNMSTMEWAKETLIRRK